VPEILLVLSPGVTDDAPDAATSLALERTRLAHERTLMAWVRTAVSLITLGAAALMAVLLQQ
jgi:uncharacterized membrane protein YidH (DUF202 family)